MSVSTGHARQNAGFGGTAVVFGPGGLVGTAWTAGLVAGLAHAGVELAAADLVVGTSAGAIVAAALTTGQDLDRFARPSRPRVPDPAVPPPEPARFALIMSVLGDATLARAEALRRVGRLALDAAPVPEEVVIARMESLIHARLWPHRRVLITAVDIESGRPVVWDRRSGVPLISAVAASCAAPGAYPPITIRGRRYMDGALAGGSNAHLAEGADRLVLIEPMPHATPMADRDVAGSTRSAIRITPDEASLAAFGSHPFDRSAWEPAYRAGRRQSVETVERLRVPPFLAGA